jgi:sec-independent protein translocase protein TatB
MFDISWTEFLLIGVIALIVIGPKELPAVMRTMGQWTRKVRSMASDFQGQFQEAMREAEMADLKKQVDDVAHDIKSYNPLNDVRTSLETTGQDIQAALEQKSPLTTASSDSAAAPAVPMLAAEPAITPPAPAASAPQDVVAAAIGPVAPEAVAESVSGPAAPEPSVEAPESEIVAAATAPVVPERVAEAAGPESKGARNDA